MFDLSLDPPVHIPDTEEDLPTSLRTLYQYQCTMEDALHRMTLSMVQVDQAVGLMSKVQTRGVDFSKEDITSLRYHAPVLATRLGLTTPMTVATESYRVYTEANIAYEIFNFITATIRKIYEAIRDSIKWIFRQFKPSTHYKAMLEKRYSKYFKSNVRIDEKMFESTTMIIEPYDTMYARVQALTIIAATTKDTLAKHRSIQDDSDHQLITTLTPHIETLEYTVSPDNKRVMVRDSVTEADAGRLKQDKKWTVTKLKHIIPEVLKLIDDQTLFKQIENKLKQLEKETANIEKKMAKVANTKSKTIDKSTGEYERIRTIIAYVMFFSTLGKMYSAQVQKIAFKHINLCDKLRLSSDMK